MSGKHTMWPGLEWRTSDKVEAFGTIEDPDHKQVGEPLDISQPLLKFRQDRQCTFFIVSGDKALRNFARFHIRAEDISNRPRRKHHRLPRVQFPNAATNFLNQSIERNPPFGSLVTLTATRGLT